MRTAASLQAQLGPLEVPAEGDDAQHGTSGPVQLFGSPRMSMDTRTTGPSLRWKDSLRSSMGGLLKRSTTLSGVSEGRPSSSGTRGPIAGYAPARSLVSKWRSTAQVLRSAPLWTIALPLLTLALIIVAGEVSVAISAQRFRQERHVLTSTALNGMVVQLDFLLQSWAAPIVAAAAVVAEQPYVPQVVASSGEAQQPMVAPMHGPMHQAMHHHAWVPWLRCVPSVSHPGITAVVPSCPADTATRPH